MTCRHPLAARKVRYYSPVPGDVRLITVCWACEVEAEARVGVSSVTDWGRMMSASGRLVSVTKPPPRPDAL